MEKLIEQLTLSLQQVNGFLYPNELELHWGLLIVLYPYITGLVAGAFILASLERVFNVKEVEPTYRLSLLTALSFLLVATFPLLAHLGRPERAYEIFITPNTTSAMAMFGFVYAWYLMVVLCLEIWFDYRKDIVILSNQSKGIKKIIYSILTLGIKDISKKAVDFDDKAGKFITIIGIPSAFLLHGYVGFIFGSVKANPWWSSVLMPIVFLFSAIVSGIALMILIYMITTMLRKKQLDMICMEKLGSFLLYAMILDFSLEILDFIHRIYQSEESIKILSQLLFSKLFISMIVLQVFIGMIIPMILLVWVKFSKLTNELKIIIYFITTLLVEIGIFSTRWNVVIGGQLFSKSLRGLTTYKVELLGLEGLLMSISILILPFVILFALTKILPPYLEEKN